MNSIPCGIEKIKALVEAGTDINDKTKTEYTAAIDAIQMKAVLEYAHYLIVQKKAKISELHYRRKSYFK